MEMTRESRIRARSWFGLVTLSCLLVICHAGPLPNVTFSENGAHSESCSVGDVVYMPGDNFPGTTPCERCSCAAGGVQCAKQTCESRPGCKAVHRPDHCCPTYQCECEQDGRVYGNGEKLVDPHDPCRVCYCQGGEVVCRRISCFLRDDCKPRLVIGRCCPEYDDCPLTGVSTISGLVPSSTAIEEISLTSPSPPPAEKLKPEITIKEITPVSEIPVVTGVKIKEILPSPNIDIGEYSSSKSPLITREATSERPINSESNAETAIRTSNTLPPSSVTSITTEDTEKTAEIKGNAESSPSKISLPTQEKDFFTNTDKTVLSEATQAATVFSSTKAPVIEEEETAPFEHNPAFPPIPDDLSVPRNQDEDVILEMNVDNAGFESNAAPRTTIVQATVTKEPVSITEATKTTSTTTVKSTTTTTSTTTQAPRVEITAETIVTEKQIKETHKLNDTLQESVTQKSAVKQAGTKISPMLNLRSAIPTELLSEPLNEGDDINGQLDDDDINLTTTVLTFKKSTTPIVHVVTPVPNINLKSTEISNEPVIVVLSTPTTADEKVPLKRETISVGSDKITTKISDVKYYNNESVTKKLLKMPSTTSQSPIPADTVMTEKTNQIKNKPTEMPAILTTDVSKLEITDIENPETVYEKTSLSNDKGSLKLNTIHNIEGNKPGVIESELTTENTVGYGIIKEVKNKKNTNLPTVPIVEMLATTTLSAEGSEVSTVYHETPTSIKILATEAEPITIAREPTSISNTPDSLETTEFIITPSESSTTTTARTEIIKPLSSEKNAQIIEAGSSNKNMLKDFISLVGDVASISGHTEDTSKQKTPGSFSESEELITVGAGYKSKNKNWNVNSISEVTTKPKNMQATKVKGVEMENEDSGNITDLPAPNDKVEPTTQMPIIDKVTDDMPKTNKTEKDIEIIQQSYVPAINRQPSKLVKKNKPAASEEINVSGSEEDSTDDGLSIEDVTTVASIPIRKPLRFSAMKSTLQPVPQ